jgi:RimJ/RimL family protein N-acetyltransferase
MIPTLTTERLVLRPPRADDFDAYAAFFASDRAVWEDGPISRRDAWSEFATAAGGWLLRGFGSLSVTDRTTGAWLGEVGLYQPDHYPEPEIGWILGAEAEGRGIAHEAAVAVRRWAYATLGLDTLVSYIARGNRRSIRLAERLGAVPDPDAPSCAPDAGVWRHPGPEALQ